MIEPHWEAITESDFYEEGALVKVAGLSDRNEMLFIYGRFSSASITDGISVSIPGKFHNAGWVMALDDLERVYLDAKKYRDSA